MRKRVFLALLMVVAIAMTTSCGLIVKDAETDKQTVIIDVAGKQITKQTVSDATQQVLSYQAQYYSYFGMSYDPTDAQTIADAQDSAITELVRNAVVNQKATETGMDTFTDEELAELQESAETSFTEYTDSVKSAYFADTTLEGEELDKAIADKMTELGYPSKDDMLAELLANAKTTKASEKLKADVVKDVAVTDEEIQTEYDTKLEAAKTSYASSLTQYGNDLSNGTTIYYRPAGYRYVKNLLIQLKEEDSTAINDLQSQLTTKQSDLDTANTSFEALPEDATTDTEDQAKSRTELTASKATLESEIAELTTKLDAAKETAFANIQATVDEVAAKIAAGEDFDALIEQYGEDTGMKSEPAKSTGYAVCAGNTTYVTEFVDASMALAKIGDVSPATRTSYGVHFIQYASDVEEGAVSLDELKDTISASLLTTKQDSQYNTTVDQWVTEANAKIYKDRMN